MRSADRTFAAQSQAARAADLYLAPDAAAVAARAELARAVSDLDEDRAADTLGVFRAASGDASLGGYGLLYLGRAQLAAGQVDEAVATSQRLQATSPSGYLAESAHRLGAEAATAASNPHPAPPAPSPAAWSMAATTRSAFASGSMPVRD
jgi:hypothetical protein